MKKITLFSVIFCFLLSISAINAANDSASISITGTTQINSGNLAIMTVSASSSSPVKQISGTICYDYGNLMLFSIKQAEGLEGWKFTIDTTIAGIISYTGICPQDGDGPIEAARELFTIQFVSVGNLPSTTTVFSNNTTGITTQQTITVHAGDVLNQKAIDEARAAVERGENVIIPEPIYAQKDEYSSVDKEIVFDDTTHQVQISVPKSSNAYLKSISAKNGTISPAFSKLTNSYKLQIDQDKEVQLECLKADGAATVEIGPERNNQIVITVTAEDKTTNTYVITIVRNKTGNSPDDNPQKENNPVNPPINQPIGIDTPAKIVLIGVSGIAVIGLLFGAIIVNKASKR